MWFLDTLDKGTGIKSSQNTSGIVRLTLSTIYARLEVSVSLLPVKTD